MQRLDPLQMRPITQTVSASRAKPPATHPGASRPASAARPPGPSRPPWSGIPGRTCRHSSTPASLWCQGPDFCCTRAGGAQFAILHARLDDEGSMHSSPEPADQLNAPCLLPLAAQPNTSASTAAKLACPWAPHPCDTATMRWAAIAPAFMMFICSSLGPSFSLQASGRQGEGWEAAASWALTGPGCWSHELKGSTSVQEGGRKAAGSYTAPPVPACMLGGPPPGLLPHLNLPPTCTPLPPEHFFVFLWDLQQVEVLHGGLPGAGHGAGTQCACECLCTGQPFSPALLCRQSPAQGLQQASLCRPLLPVLFAGGQAPPPASRQFARPPVTGASPAPGARCCAAPARCVRTPAVQSRDSGCAQAQSEGGKKG